MYKTASDDVVEYNIQYCSLGNSRDAVIAAVVAMVIARCDDLVGAAPQSVALPDRVLPETDCPVL